MLFNDDEVRRRRREIATSPDLQSLAHRLRTHLQPVLDNANPPIPGKARLTRHGGVCPDDRTRLSFDPLSPDLHRCPRCQNEVRGELHDANWRWWYHLWLSERVLQLAVLGTLLEEPQLHQRGIELVNAYAKVYPTLPNQDNVLGPTRLFFSTYLESIWLAQMALAIGFLSRDAVLERPVRTMVRQSADLIREFDEGWSNRQVWHNTAMMAAGVMLDDAELFAHGIGGPHGIREQLSRAVTTDGLWFEGENYHFFALRGLQLAAEIARSQGVHLYDDSETKKPLAAMLTAPILTLYPDLTMPARGDSPFGVSVVQPRFAELWEVGLVRTNESALEGLLADIYEVDATLADDHGFAEIAEHEVHRPASKFSRGYLGWRALMWMRPEWSPGKPMPTREVAVLHDAGIAVVRPDADTCVSVNVGGIRGGHGHPDLLHADIVLGAPVILDPGTASYVDESLHWYRSPFAHNGPTLIGTGSTELRGWCVAADAQGGWGWCRAHASGASTGEIVLARTLIAGSKLVLDVVDVYVADHIDVALPIHLFGGGGGSDDLTRVSGDPCPGQVMLVPRAGEERSIQAGLSAPNYQLAPGEPTAFVVRQAKGSGQWIQVYAQAGVDLHVVDVTQTSVRVLCDGEVVRIEWSDTQAVVRESARSEISLKGRRDPPKNPASEVRVLQRRQITIPRSNGPLHPLTWIDQLPAEFVYDLGAGHYLRSENAYMDGDSVRARGGVAVNDATVEFAVDVMKRDLTFRTAADVDPELDNEVPDIHSDGIQCYVGRDGWISVLAVPDRGSDEVRCILGAHSGNVRATGNWAKTPEGYSIVVRVTVPGEITVGETILIDMMVNEMYPERERRAGQLVLSGGGGWVYLRGDRLVPSNALVGEVV